MDFSRIERLLVKYWECETTLEEEKELKIFFNAANVPDHLKEYTLLFQYFETERQAGNLDTSFDEEVLGKLKTSDTKTAKPKGKLLKLFQEVSRVAAVGLVLITAGYFIYQEYNDKKVEVQALSEDTFEDPQAAFEETKKALQMISANFNRGRNEVKKISVFNDAQQKAKDTEVEL